MTQTASPPAPTTSPATKLRSVADMVLGWDHLEWWVGNARAFTAWLAGGFGFEVSAYAGPETGVTDRVSYLLTQGEIRLVVTAGLGPESEVARHVLTHGDGIRNLAWEVSDVNEALQVAANRGATIAAEPTTLASPVFPADHHRCGGPTHGHGDDGSMTTAAIITYGDTRHVLVDRTDWRGVWAPGFSDIRLPQRPLAPPVRLTYIDHVVGNVEEGRLDRWVDFYRNVIGFEEMKHFEAEQISTQYSALRSTVMHNGCGITMPINEPAPGLKKSQITEYLEAYRGPGVQHIALGSATIVESVDALRARGVRFLDMPSTYYEDARKRCAQLELEWAELERSGIEVDADTGGYLLQIFTETLTDRPSVFLEIIQREGATGFGEGNFKALFEAIERAQARRGNL